MENSVNFCLQGWWEAKYYITSVNVWLIFRYDKLELDFAGNAEGFLWIGNLPDGTKAADLKARVAVYGNVSTKCTIHV